jgi:predicted alpha/beta-hydrolase family hydrolase
MTPSSERFVDTCEGRARVLLHAAANARVTLVLGHGAGAGVDTPDLTTLAATLPAYAVSVALVEQPWRVAGRRVATAPPVLDRAWRAVVPALDISTPVVVGGRSAGARVACRTAADLGAAAVLALAFPLHPPGRPDRSRWPELAAAARRLPTLVMQGERDAFGRPGEFPAAADGPGFAVRAVPGADHSFAVPKRAHPGRDEVLAALARDVADWLTHLPE